MPIYPEVKRDWPSQPLLPAVPGWRNAADFFRGEALVELPLGVLRLGGSGRLEWLNNVTTQEVANLEPGTSTEALTLDPAGHIDLAFYIYEDGEHTWLFTEEPQASREFLQAMRFRAQVDIEDLSSSLRTLGFLEFPGKKSPLQAKLDPLSQAQFSDPWPGPVGNTTTYTAHLQTHPGSLDGGRRRIVAVTTRTFDEVLDEGGVKWADFALWEADRVMRWRPRLGREGMPGVLPHEIDWLRSAVALEKGCYTGQETVAKLVNRGRPPRRLVFLDLDGSREELPAVGAEILREDTGEKVGVLTSVAHHPQEGRIGLGLVSRRLDPQAVLLVEGMRAAQTPVVDPSGDNPKRMDSDALAEVLSLRARGGSGACQAGNTGGKSPFVKSN